MWNCPATLPFGGLTSDPLFQAFVDDNGQWWSTCSFHLSEDIGQRGVLECCSKASGQIVELGYPGGIISLASGLLSIGSAYS